jgi:prepilin peptidase CpaA
MVNLLLISSLLISLITDLRERKIYNIVTFPAILGGILFHTWNSGWQGLQFSFQGLFLGFGLLLIPYMLGGMGAGDVKLLGTIGALKGAGFVFYAFFYIAMIGGIVSIVILLNKKEFFSFWKRTIFSLQFRTIDGLNKEDLHHAFPYGLAIVMGTLLYIGVDAF